MVKVFTELHIGHSDGGDSGITTMNQCKRKPTCFSMHPTACHFKSPHPRERGSKGRCRHWEEFSVLCQHLGPRFSRPLVCPLKASGKQDWKLTYISIPQPDYFNFYCLLNLLIRKKSVPSPGFIKTKQNHHQGSLN